MEIQIGGFTVFIDDADAPVIANGNWRIHLMGKAGYPKVPYVFKGRMVGLHRLLMGAGKGDFVDHIDRNPLNNRRSNLRLVTCSQNQQNRRVPSSNTSGVKGVYWESHRNKWRAEICANGRKHSLGSFVDFNAAVQARLEAVREHHGEFAGAQFSNPRVAGAHVSSLFYLPVFETATDGNAQ